MDAEKLSAELMVDAKYLAESVERFREHPEVHLSHGGVRLMLEHYRELFTLLGVKAASTEALEHPTLKKTPIEKMDELRATSMQRLEVLHETMAPWGGPIA